MSPGTEERASMSRRRIIRQTSRHHPRAYVRRYLLEQKSLLRSGYPSKAESGEHRCSYTSADLHKTDQLLSRALTIPININKDEQIPKILKAIEKAAGVL